MKIGVDFAYYNKSESTIESSKLYLDPNIILKEIGLILIEKLKSHGAEVIDCSPVNLKLSEESISSTIEIANRENLDLFISISLNSYSHPGRNGSEIFVKNKDDIAYKKAKKIQNRLSTLGYSNHGITKTKKIKLLQQINCPSLLIQCFFATNSWDCKRYNKEQIADAIFKALISKDIILINYKSFTC